MRRNSLPAPPSSAVRDDAGASCFGNLTACIPATSRRYCFVIASSSPPCHRCRIAYAFACVTAASLGAGLAMVWATQLSWHLPRPAAATTPSSPSLGHAATLAANVMLSRSAAVAFPNLSKGGWLLTYSKYTAERCARLALGDADELRAVRFFLSRRRRRTHPRGNRPLVAAAAAVEFPCYRDDYLAAGAPCADLLADAVGGYVATRQELDFPLAFSLRVHTCATQVELLLRSIYAPHNFYCIHADGRAPASFLGAMRRLAECLPNVRLARLDPDFVYASASQMAADLECMRVARASPVPWRYLVNLAGQELPLKTNLELVRMLRRLNGSSHFRIEGKLLPKRQQYAYWCRSGDDGRVTRCQPPLRRKPPPPGKVRVRKSGANGMFSRAFAEYLLDDEYARQLYDWFNDTLCPEEHYFATLLGLPGAPGGGAWGRVRQRAVAWRGRGRRGGGHGDRLVTCASRRYVRNVCIFTSADLRHLVRRPEPFVNKLHFQNDPVAVRCLVSRIVERRRRQSAAARDAETATNLS